MTWFSAQGINLEYIPTVAYVDRESSLGERVLASVEAEELSVLGALNMPLSLFCEALYARTGLRVTSSFKEIIKVLELNRKQFYVRDEISKSDADITLYRPAKKSKARELDELIAHEVWHLIEKEKGFASGEDFIIGEGTATYAANRFAGNISGHHPEFWNFIYGSKFTQDMVLIKYMYVASLISELYGEEFNLRDLLQKSTRKKIVLHSQKMIVTPMRKQIGEEVEKMYGRLHEQAKKDHYQVVYEGAFKQAIRRGRPNTELPYTFVVAAKSPWGRSLSGRSLSGRIYDDGGAADFQGTFSEEQVHFVKRYRKAGVNSNPIEYRGRSVQNGVYTGNWNFDSATATSETSDKFIMTKV